MLAVLRMVAVFPIHCAVRVPQTLNRFVNNVKAVCQVKFCEGDCFMKKACKLAVAKNAVALFFCLVGVCHAFDTDGYICNFSDRKFGGHCGNFC